MPLSEEEQRLLDEMERNLYGSSQDVHSASPSGGSMSSRGILFGVTGLLVGLGALVLGVTLQMVILGAVGFVVMFLGVVAALSIKVPRAGSSTSAPRTTSSRVKRSFMQRLEDRWDEQQHP